MRKYFYYDLHCHTNLSPDAPLTIKELVKTAKERGLDGVAITNHNKIYNGPENINGIDIIPGIEVDVEGGVHLLGYFVEKKIEKNKNFQETVKRIHLQDGFAIWAHPLRKEGVFEENKEAVCFVDGLESGNAMDLKSHQKKGGAICRENGLLSTAGSDAHVKGQVGTAVLKVHSKITKSNFKEVVREGDVIVRKEIDNFRASNQVWKKRLTYFFQKTKVEKSEFLKIIFCRIILRNYLRLNDLHLKKIKFNYQEEERDGGEEI
jgi:predicted metal-dependent phosphoesterase TrpH